MDKNTVIGLACLCFMGWVNPRAVFCVLFVILVLTLLAGELPSP